MLAKRYYFVKIINCNYEFIFHSYRISNILIQVLRV